ncbi:MAG TPA: NAD(P)/FAD-dependent oxidoreductase [Fimbriimonadales bacterium]|nr:NAD(P)/FAD-dependent oxidoreductase [Fimbriimonadales bacterium]
MSEIQIIGAGPSGLTAAIHLATKGFEVRVREKRKAPGMRHHGFQGLDNWSHKEDAKEVLKGLGIRADFLLRPVFEVLYISPKRKVHPVRSREPLFYLVRRGNHPDSLDAKLAWQAIELGVRISYNDPVAQAPPGAIVGIGPTSAKAIAKGIQFRTDMPDIAMCIVDPEIAPKAYAYLLVHEKEATLAVMLTEEFKKANDYLKNAIEAFQSIRKFDIEEATTFGGAGIPFDATPTMGGQLRVGECSGAQDALWGFGLWFAMESGYLAAKCLVENKDYRKEFRKKLLPKIQRLLVCRWLFERIQRNSYERYFEMFESTDALEVFRKYYGNASWMKFLYPFAVRHFQGSLPENRRYFKEFFLDY